MCKDVAEGLNMFEKYFKKSTKVVSKSKNVTKNLKIF